MDKKINIAIIDDHDLFREGLALVLEQIEEFGVVFSGSNGLQFLDFLKYNSMDIVLMDINMPVIDGIQTTKKAVEINPGIDIIALTMFSDYGHYTRMIDAGAKGFLLKNANKPELKQAILSVYDGGNYFSIEILRKLTSKPGGFPAGTCDFSSREIEIIELICKGLTSPEIAEKLFISLKTVETHRTHIFRKSGIRNVGELIIWAIKNNYFCIE